MCTTKVSPTLATTSPLASINMPELSMATCPRGSLSTAKISPADAATARCTSSRSGMGRLSHPRRGRGPGDTGAVPYDPTIYLGSAAYYRYGRPAYSPELEAVLTQETGLDG